MLSWDCRSKFWKLRQGEISFYQQVLSVGAKHWHFLCLWQASITEHSMALLELRVCSPLANPVIYITACAGTDWKPNFLSLFSLAAHEKMFCFLCASCFYLPVKEGEYLGVSTKVMTANTILSAVNQDSWNCLTDQHCWKTPCKGPSTGSAFAEVLAGTAWCSCTKIWVSKAAICRLWFLRSWAEL